MDMLVLAIIWLVHSHIFSGGDPIMLNWMICLEDNDVTHVSLKFEHTAILNVSFLFSYFRKNTKFSHCNSPFDLFMHVDSKGKPGRWTYQEYDLPVHMALVGCYKAVGLLFVYLFKFIEYYWESRILGAVFPSQTRSPFIEKLVALFTSAAM